MTLAEVEILAAYWAASVPYRGEAEFVHLALRNLAASLRGDRNSDPHKEAEHVLGLIRSDGDLAERTRANLAEIEHTIP